MVWENKRREMPTINQREDCCHGCCPNPFLGHPDHYSSQPQASMSTAEAARNEFQVATTSAFFPNPQEFTNHESLPSLHESFSNFTEVFPYFSQTDKADQIRDQDYFHLSLSKHVCFDYIGHGLFSYSQLKSYYSKPNTVASTSSSPPLFSELEPPFFDISCKSGNLSSWIQYGGEESELQSSIRKRIMAFMNISEDEYSMVFTANQSSALKLLAESYPFQSNTKLVTVYDYENEAVQVMSESAKRRGAKVISGEFSWPDLRIQSKKLMKKIVEKNKKRSNRGLFVFPLQSRMTGSTYSYQWMNVAQGNGWHVLLDASGLGAKDMDTLGLSLFKPDFLFCSFYKIFGENPSGFGCLFINKSSSSLFKTSTPDSSIGIVNLVPSMRTYQFPNDSTMVQPETEELEKADIAASESTSEIYEAENTIVKHHRQASFSQILEAETLHDDDSSQAKITKEDTKLKCKGLDHEELKKDDIAATESTSEVHEAEKTVVKHRKELSLSQILEAETLHDDSNQAKITKEDSISRNRELECRGLDHADSLGLILISNRARYLINWLVHALMSLQHPYTENRHPLVRIYGPKVKFDRGPAIAFNVFDWNGDKVDPALVQRLADRYNISVSCGFLQHICFSDKYEEEKKSVWETTRKTTQETAVNKRGGDAVDSGISVVTAALGLLTNFEDIYRLWAFVSRFLDADFVQKERWRYLALNQKTIEI